MNFTPASKASTLGVGAASPTLQAIAPRQNVDAHSPVRQTQPQIWLRAVADGPRYEFRSVMVAGLCVCSFFFIWTLVLLAVQNQQTNKQSFLCTTDRMGELGPRGNSADRDRIGWRVGAHRRRNGNVPHPVFVWVGEGREPSRYDKHHYKSDFIAVGADSKKKLIHSCSVRMTIDDKRINVHWRMFARVFS